MMNSLNDRSLIPFISIITRSSFVLFQENNISRVDCENMTSLRVLKLGHNKLTSIHGLAGAENLDVLDLSHNSITRIGEKWETAFNDWVT